MISVFSRFKKTNTFFKLKHTSDQSISAVFSSSSCLRASFHCAGRTMNALQYCWVGSTCVRPPYHDYTHMPHIKQALWRTLAFVKLSALSLFGTHAPMTGRTFVSSPLTEECRFCSITIVNPVLPLCSFGPAWANDKENPPLPDPRSAFVSPAHFTGEGSLHAAAVL